MVDEKRSATIYVGDGAGTLRVWALTPSGHVKRLPPIDALEGGGGPSPDSPPGATSARFARPLRHNFGKPSRQRLALGSPAPPSPAPPPAPPGAPAGGGARRAPALRAVACVNWLVLAASADGTVVITDAWTGQLARLPTGSAAVRAMALGRHGELFTAAADGRVSCWSFEPATTGLSPDTQLAV